MATATLIHAFKQGDQEPSNLILTFQLPKTDWSKYNTFSHKDAFENTAILIRPECGNQGKYNDNTDIYRFAARVGVAFQ